MALVACPECGREVSERASACPHCGNPFKSPEATPATLAGGLPGAQFALVAAGACVVAVGAFLPLVQAPIVGAVTAMSGNARPGLVILACSALALAAGWFRWHNFASVIGLALFGGVLYKFMDVRDAMSRTSAEGASRIGAEAVAEQMVRFGLGFLFLAVGSLLLVAAADWIRRRRSPHVPAASTGARVAISMATVLLIAVMAGDYWNRELRQGSPGHVRRREAELRAAVARVMRYEDAYLRTHGVHDFIADKWFGLRSGVPKDVEMKFEVVRFRQPWNYALLASAITSDGQRPGFLCAGWVPGPETRTGPGDGQVGLKDWHGQVLPPREIKCTRRDTLAVTDEPTM